MYIVLLQMVLFFLNFAILPVILQSSFIVFEETTLTALKLWPSKYRFLGCKPQFQFSLFIRNKIRYFS